MDGADATVRPQHLPIKQPRYVKDGTDATIFLVSPLFHHGFEMGYSYMAFQLPTDHIVR